LNGIQEVSGSIPLGSTKKNKDLTRKKPRQRGAFSVLGRERAKSGCVGVQSDTAHEKGPQSAAGLCVD